MVLGGMGVPFKEIDITIRGNEDHRDFMREKAQVRCNGVALPPQIIYNDEYLGVSSILLILIIVYLEL